MGYGKAGVFVFRVTQTDGNGRLLRIDTIGLYCTDALNERTAMQWQFVSSGKNGEVVPDEKRYDGSWTRNEVNDSELFIHPPREDCFRILQLCPYPYFFNNTNNGSWTWDFAVGPNWATPPWYPIKKIDTFHVSYRNTGIVLMDTHFGKLNCHKVTAISKSVFGKSTADYYLTNDLGIVNCTMTAVNGQTFRFELVRKMAGEEALAPNRDFASIQKRRAQERNTARTEEAMQYLGISTQP